MKDMREEAKKFAEFWTFQRGSEKGEAQSFWNSLLISFLGIFFVPMIAVSDQNEGTVAPLMITEVNLDTTGFGGKLSWHGAEGVSTDTTIDVFGAWPSITNDWRWVGEIPLYGVTTNCQWRFGADRLGLTEMPSGVFVKMTERSTTANTMVDSDGDLIPDVYELNHGTNPYVADFEDVPKLTVGSTGDYTTLSSALGSSVPYSVVELPRGEDVDANGVVMPAHPVMIVGPTNGYAFVKTTAAPYAFALQDGQDYETIYQNLYIEMLPSLSQQVAFWCGSNNPIGVSGGYPAASATFRNIYIRAKCGSGRGIGWFVRKWQLSPIEIDHCTINADGSNHFIGISAVNAPSITVKNSTFVNFPPEVGNDYGAAIQEEVVGVTGDNYAVTITNCVFDASFTNAYPWARLGTGSVLEVHNVILPEGYRNDYESDTTSGVIVSTNAVVSWTGHAIPGGIADTHGIGSMAALGEADQTDSDGDGLRDWEEIYVYGTNPYRLDSDGDKVSDAVEVFQGSNPCDANDYCFTISLSQSITLCTNNVVTITLGENGISDDYTATYHVTNGVRPTLTMSNGTHSVNLAYQITGSAIELGSLDTDRDGMPDIWELSAGLNPNDGEDVFADSDDDGLINYYEHKLGYNPLALDGTNSLLSVCSKSVDDRISSINGENAVAMFENYFANGASNVFVRNENYWARDIDLSCVSVWQSSGEDVGSKCATAITKRHVIMSKHWNSSSYIFCGTNNQCVSKSVVSTYGIPNCDIMIGRLDSDLPDYIVPAKLLPLDYEDYLGEGKCLPVLCLNQNKSATILEINELRCNQVSSSVVYENLCSFSSTNRVSTTRSQVRGSTLDGNSGSPSFLIVDNIPIFLCAKHLGSRSVQTWSTTWGPSVVHWQNAIQERIDMWEGGESGEYRLDIMSFDGYERVGD